MPEQDNDRLERFFQKAASGSDVPFNEDDWKKLEAMLDAEDAVSAPPPRGQGGRFAAAATISLLLLLSAGVGFYLAPGTNSPDGAQPVDSKVSSGSLQPAHSDSPAAAVPAPKAAADPLGKGNETSVRAQKESGLVLPAQELSTSPATALDGGRVPEAAENRSSREVNRARNFGKDYSDADVQTVDGASADFGRSGGNLQKLSGAGASDGVITNIAEEQIFRDLIATSPARDERDKQRAIMELPGAEEETRAAESASVQELPADRRDETTRPGLSLLLSFAPDFSSTDVNRYDAPGKAYGAMIRYHATPRWSITAGAIKNHKQYTGAGEDYTPPEGYWQYATNGKVPSTIDGACTILEFPLMIHYTVLNERKTRLLAGLGASSYLMLDESYTYHFSDPNPGAKEGWASSAVSPFFFNMVNLNVAFERQLGSRLYAGVQPYVKIPVEEIGWTNLKLFSTGASFTLRYIVLRKGDNRVSRRSRGPD